MNIDNICQYSKLTLLNIVSKKNTNFNFITKFLCFVGMKHNGFVYGLLRF